VDRVEDGSGDGEIEGEIEMAEREVRDSEHREIDRGDNREKERRYIDYKDIYKDVWLSSLAQNDHLATH
jgi:hypothetical protein